ncbi:MAG: glutathione-dependent formaldehyde dehydrogenase, partial [Bacillus sp. (in: firmicutes)]
MRAGTYQGKYSVSVENVEDPTIQDTQDVIVKITSTALCGSD